MMRIFLFVTAINMYHCSDESISDSTPKHTVLFKAVDKNIVFTLRIENDFVYYDSMLNNDIVPGYAIGVYPKKKDSSNIYLKINGKDTLFKFPLFKVDSMLFGLHGDGGFFIRSNYNRNDWIVD